MCASEQFCIVSSSNYLLFPLSPTPHPPLPGSNLASLPTLVITMKLDGTATHDFPLTPEQYTVRTPGTGGAPDQCLCGLFAFDAGEGALCPSVAEIACGILKPPVDEVAYFTWGNDCSRAFACSSQWLCAGLGYKYIDHKG